MEKYIVKYENYQTVYDPYVTPRTGYKTVIAYNEEDAEKQVEGPGCSVLSVTRE